MSVWIKYYNPLETKPVQQAASHLSNFPLSQPCAVSFLQLHFSENIIVYTANCGGRRENNHYRQQWHKCCKKSGLVSIWYQYNRKLAFPNFETPVLGGFYDLSQCIITLSHPDFERPALGGFYNFTFTLLIRWMIR